jgi:alpha-1,2-mannosyltransferase
MTERRKRELYDMKRLVLAVLFLIGAWWPLKVFFDFEPMAGRDFAVWWGSGHAIRVGVNPYDVEAFKAFGKQILGSLHFNYTYPPHALFLFVPLSYLPLLPAFIVWNVASAVFFWFAARPLIPKGMPTILAILTPGALININYGQTGLLWSALFMLAFRGSGLAAAALTFKPHFGLLVIPAMLRDRRAFIFATLGTLFLIAASALTFGYWVEFFEHAFVHQGGLIAGYAQTPWYIKGTAPAIGYGLWGWIPFALGGAYFLARNYNLFTAATAAFLISPYGLHYDMPLVCLGFAVMLYARWGVMPWSHKLSASLAFLTPSLVVYATAWAIPPILLWGLVVQTKWTEGLRLHVRLGERGVRRFACEPTPAVSA